MKRLKNPATTATALAVGAVLLWGAYAAYQVKKARAKRTKLYPRLPGTVCPEGTVFDGTDCVAPDPSVYPGPKPPPPPPPPEPPIPEPPKPGDKLPTTGDRPDPLPSDLLPLSPADDPCIKNLYERKPIRVPLVTFQRWGKAARDFTRSRLYYIRWSKFAQLAQLIRQRYTTWPSLRHVVVRDALKQLAPTCSWYVDDKAMGNAQQNVWISALDLAHAIEIDLGWSPPRSWSDLPEGYDDEILGRTILGLPSPGAYNLKPDQVVELIAIDPSLRFAEHIFAKVLHYDDSFDCFEIKTIGRFQERKVAPEFASRHGVDVGDTGCLHRTGGGAYRVFPHGVS